MNGLLIVGVDDLGNPFPLIRLPDGSHLLLSRRRLTPLSATQTFPLSRGIPEGEGLIGLTDYISGRLGRFEDYK